MRLTVERLRWALIAGGSLLVLALAGWIGLGRYRAVRNWQRILARSGATLTHETNGITLSQSVQGRTIFTLHAAKGIQHSDGKWGFHDVVLTLYGRVADRADRIYGSDFEYDEKEGVARALGEVHMDLQAPAALATAGRASPRGLDEATAPRGDNASGSQQEKGEGGDIIHVRTSGLVYMRKLDVAATDQEVEFLYRGIQGRARGAEFNSAQSTLHLLSEVHLQGVMRNQPVDLTATKADMDRSSETIALQAPVVRSGARGGSAEHALLHLRQDGSLERAEAEGAVLLRDGERTLRGNRLEGSFSAKAEPETAKLSGGVTLADAGTVRPVSGTASEMAVSFDGQGVAETITAAAVHLGTLSRVANGPALRRQLSGDHLTAKLGREGKKGSASLTQLDVIGSARILAESPVGPSPAGGAVRDAGLRKVTEMSADHLVGSFAASGSGRAVLQRMRGDGHTVLQQNAPAGQSQSSSGDALLLTFASRQGAPQDAGSRVSGDALELVSAVQTGNVLVHSRGATKAGAPSPVPTTARAERAVYTAAADELELSGGEHGAAMEQGGLSLSARSITLHTATGDASAEGSLVATVQNDTPGGAAKNTSGQNGGPQNATAQNATHVLAERARLVHATQIAEFNGTDAHPARMWQGASQVEAASLLFDGVRRTLSARPEVPGGLIHAVFAEGENHAGAEKQATVANADEGMPKHKRPAGPGTRFLRVSSGTMDYADGQHNAILGGGVRLEGSLGQARSDRAVVLFEATAAKLPGASASTSATASPLGTGGPVHRSIQRVVLLGAVAMEQPGRRATGEQLTYTAATGEYVLTGTAAKPPRVDDAQRGEVSGATLLFGGEGSTIIVAGDQGKGKATPDRVRTEIVVGHP